MSLKYRNASGVETPVAGLNGTSGELVPSVALQQSGRDNHPQSTVVEQGYQTSYTVTFTTPMPDADYEIVLSPIRVESVVSLNSKTENGFTYYIRVLSPVSGDFGADWTAVKFMTDEVHEADSNHIARNTANFAPAFSDVTSYAVGDYCTYNNVLYRCTTAHTAGVWVAGHFTQVTVGSYMQDNQGFIAQRIFDNDTSIYLRMDSTAYRKVTIYQDNQLCSFVVHEWSAQCLWHWIVGSSLPSGVTYSYSNYVLTLTNNSYGTARIIIEAPSSPLL